MSNSLFCIIQLFGLHVTREVAEEVPNQASRRLEVPMAIVIDSDKTDHRLIAFIQLTKLHRDVFALARMNLTAVLQLESEGWIVLRFWGNEIKKNAAQCADIIEKVVNSK
mgnify:CR=1 FL=1